MHLDRAPTDYGISQALPSSPRPCFDLALCPLPMFRLFNKSVTSPTVTLSDQLIEICDLTDGYADFEIHLLFACRTSESQLLQSACSVKHACWRGRCSCGPMET